MSRPIKRRPKRRVSKSRESRLDPLVGEAVVDCYGESEQITGLYTMMDAHLSVPFKTMVLGVPVTVERVNLNEREEIVAVCRRDRIRQTALSANVRETVTPWKFSVEGESGSEADEYGGADPRWGRDRSDGEGDAAAVHPRLQTEDRPGGRRV
jgi:hypothetical protein